MSKETYQFTNPLELQIATSMRTIRELAKKTRFEIAKQLGLTETGYGAIEEARSMNLKNIIRAADLLGYEVVLTLRPKK